MKNFVIAFHVCCETKEQAHQWRMSALQILDQNTHALGYKPDETGDLNCHCSGHADEENGEEEIPLIPAPVVSTAAPEPPIEMIAGTHNKKEDAASASPQSARDRTEPTGQPEPVSRCNLQSSELAPESYKPAEGPEPLSYEQEIHSLLCAAASNTENLLEYFQIQAAKEKGEAKKLTHKCIAWKREQLRRIREIIPKALAAKNKPAATPVTVEAPESKEWVGHFPICRAICFGATSFDAELAASNHCAKPQNLTQTDIANLRFYADMAAENDWDTLQIASNVVAHTLREIADRMATPKPIGDVEAVAAEIWRFVHAHYRAEITKQEIAAILSPFFAPGPEKEKK